MVYIKNPETILIMRPNILIYLLLYIANNWTLISCLHSNLELSATRSSLGNVLIETTWMLFLLVSVSILKFCKVETRIWFKKRVDDHSILLQIFKLYGVT